MDWIAGVSRGTIVPTEPIPLAGYFDRLENWTHVNSPLSTKALALKDSAGNSGLLITADLLGFTAELADAVSASIMKQTGLPRSSILLNGSHTHSGAFSMGEAFPRYSGDGEAVTRYFNQVVDTIARAAVEAFDSMEPVRLSWGTGVAEFVINRRQYTNWGVILGDNPRGLADRSVPVLHAERQDGTTLAVVFGAACHNVTNERESLVLDGDYSGHAQRILEEQMPGAQAMFVIGCAGDARPHPRGGADLALRHGQALAAEVLRVLSDQRAPVNGPLQCAFEMIDLPLRQFSSRQEIEPYLASGLDYYEFFAKEALKLMDSGQSLPDTYKAPLAVWQFGNDLTLVGICGETVVDYVAQVEQAIGPLRLWIAGYCNDMFGYLPSARVLAEGGYEARGLYTAVGLFSPEVEPLVVAAIKRMAQDVGRHNGHPPCA